MKYRLSLSFRKNSLYLVIKKNNLHEDYKVIWAKKRKQNKPLLKGKKSDLTSQKEQNHQESICYPEWGKFQASFHPSITQTFLLLCSQNNS